MSHMKIGPQSEVSSKGIWGGAGIELTTLCLQGKRIIHYTTSLLFSAILWQVEADEIISPEF